ncbi:MAG: isopentenyl-diphosphate delta-isomerase [Legionellales bacterium]|nr:isopentenyl-diphosphate delta-isomerase [Legionellales bacterium]
MEPEVILVDEHDQQIGTAKKLAAHQQALCHRAFSVFVLRNSAIGTEVLLQQRQVNKYHCGGLWTNTCCSHPYPNEDTHVAAERRLLEEMGIKATVQFIGKFHYVAKFENGLTENEIDHVFIAPFTQQDFQINSSEVQDYQWVLLADIFDKILAKPQQYTPWLEASARLVQNYLATR